VSLRWKILALIAAASLAIIGAVYAVSAATFQKSFQSIEDSHARQMADRASKSLDDEVSNLRTLNHDWAAWDDTYNFVQDPLKYSSYAQVNPSDTTFASAHLNYILILDQAGKLIFGKAFDLNANREVPLPSDLDSAFLAPALVRHENVDSSVSGLVMTDAGPLMISSLPVITSQGEGPIVGTIMMGTLLNTDRVNEIANSVQLPVVILPRDAPELPPDFAGALRSLSDQGAAVALPLDSQWIAGYTLVPDIYGNPAVVVRVSMARDISLQGNTTMRYFLLSLLGLLVAFIVVLNLLLGRIIISRVGRLADHVREIRTTGDLSRRLKPGGSDELAKLKDDVNSMLGSLDKSQQLLQAQKQTEEKLRLTIQSVAEGIATADLQGTITDANQSKLTLHGYASRDEIVGRNLLDLISEEDRPRARMAMEETLTTGASAASEYRMLKKDGSLFFGERTAALIKDPAGMPVGLVISTKDITDRRSAIENLKASESKFRNLVANAASGIVTTLADGRVINANPAALLIYGYASEEEIRTTSAAARYVKREDRDRLLSLIAEKGMVTGFETRMLRQDGTPFWASLSVMRQTDPAGGQQLISIIDDITARKKAETELGRLNAELKTFNLHLENMVDERTRQLGEAVVEARAANLAKSEFLASMSHELRTPLNAIIGFSQVLEARYFGELSEKQAEYVGDILESGRHLLALINDILDLSKIEAGKMELEIAPLKIADLLKNSLSMVKEKAHDHNIRLELHLAANMESLELPADERKIKQVMFNLLSNAAKFTPEGGGITVEAVGQKEELLVTVTDTGIGISPDERKKLFEAFYQASGGIKNKTPGTGLGLSITRSIIEKHGGKIWVESAGLGKGARFFFTLPLKAAEAVQAGSSAG
jgi:PAS domain S-box-containing protein